jgi:HK97 family phage major capsid protein
MLDQGSVPWRLNCTVINTSSGEQMKFPLATAYGTATQRNEGGTIDESDPTFGQLTLDAYSYGHLIRLSNEVIADSAIDIIGFVGRHAGMALANKYEPDFCTGNGSGKPVGVMTAGTGVSGAGTATPEKLIDLQHSVSPPYRRNGQWLMNDATVAYYRKIRDGNGGTLGAWLLTPPSAPGAPESLFGAPVVTSPHVGAVGSAVKSVAFGDFSTYYVRQTPMQFDRSDDRYFEYNQTALRAIWRLDGDYAETGGVKTYQSTS